MSPPRFGFSEAARALRPTVSDIIWKLHRIIANPHSKLDEVRTARGRLLRLLKTSKFREMIVPPLALRREPTDGARAATKRLDSTELCELCGHPVPRDVAKARTRVSPSARASSSANVRTNHLTTRRAAAPSDAVRAHLTITRIEDPLDIERKSSAPPAPTDWAKSVRCFQSGI